MTERLWEVSIKRQMPLAAAILFGALPMRAHPQEALRLAADATAPAAASSAAAPAEDSGLQEVLVTAQRREENLQRTPLAVVAVSGDELVRAGVSEAQDLNKLVPGLKIGQTGVMTQFFVNGVGSGVANAYGDPTIAFNVDGVYIPRPTGINGVFYDVSRVEVLKGPQGTLYGRNAAAGAVNVITNRPTLDDSAQAGIDVGNFGQIRFSGVGNVRLGEDLAIRIAGLSSRRNGFLSDGYNDDDSHAGRVQLLWQANDRTTLLFGGDFFHQGGKGPAAVPVPFADPSNPWAGPSTAPVTAVLSAATPTVPVANRIRFFPNDGTVDDTNWGARGELNWRADSFDVTAIGSHRSTVQISNIIPGAFEQYQNLRSLQNSAEVRVASHGQQRLTWLVGLYYSNEDVNALSRTLRYFQGNSILSLTPLSDRTEAVFTQETFSVTQRLRFTGGIRYTSEKKTESGYNTAITGVTVPANGSATFSATNYKAGAEFDLGPRSLLYANYSTGFKAGGFFQGGPPNTYRPEKLTSYVLGVKNRFFDNKLQANLEAFYWDYRDKQFATFAVINPAPATALITINIPKVTFKGVTADLAYVPWHGGQVTVNAQYLNAVNQKFTYPSLVPSSNCPFTRLSNGGYLIDCSGKPLSQAPMFSATFGLTQNWDLAGRGTLAASASSHFETRTLASQTMDYVAALEQNGWWMTDLTLTYTSSNDRFNVQAYVNNLADRAVKTNGASQPTTPTVYFANVLPPRMFGVRLGVKF
jgi:iron complex outermembrane receptor protein